MIEGTNGRLGMVWLGVMLLGIAFAATVHTKDPLWLLAGAVVVLVTLLTVPFLPYGTEEEAEVHLLTGDMSDPKQRGAVIRSSIWAVPHFLALMFLGTGETAVLERMTGINEEILFVVFIVTFGLLYWEGWKFHRKDPYLGAIYQKVVAKGAGLFAIGVVLYQLAHEVFGLPALSFNVLYIAFIGLPLQFYLQEIGVRQTR